MEDLLLQALNSEHGIAVATSDPERLRQKLYKARKTDVLYISLSFVLSPTSPKTELWIVKRDEKI